MNWIDFMSLALIAAYGVGGYFTGVVRRVIGVIALYVACWAATNMGLQAGNILGQSSNLEISDARVYGFFGIIVAVLVLVEVATQLGHGQIQVPALALNHALGAIVGVITAVVLSVILIHEIGAAANPFGGPQLDQMEQHLRDTYNGSAFAVTLATKLNPPIVGLFQPVLPSDPQVYFGPGPVNP